MSAAYQQWNCFCMCLHNYKIRKFLYNHDLMFAHQIGIVHVLISYLSKSIDYEAIPDSVNFTLILRARFM